MSFSTESEGQNPEQQVLYVQIRDDVVDSIIEHGLSKTESKLFFYLYKLDRFGDKPSKLKVVEILLATGIGKTAYHAAMSKFETLGWFDFKHTEVEVSNLCTPMKKFGKANNSSESRIIIPNTRFGKTSKKFGKTNSEIEKTNKKIGIADLEFGKTKNETPEPVPSKVSETPHTLQTYSDLINTLSEGMRECFEKFCKKKMDEAPWKIGSKRAWLNARGAEYLEEFKETYSDAVEGGVIALPKAEKIVPDIRTLKIWYPEKWEEVAINHHGYELINGEYILPNSPAVENEETIDW